MVRAKAKLWAPLILLGLPLGCATVPAAAPADRYSPDQMRSGPSLQETGRFGVTSVSTGGLRIQDGTSDGPVTASAPPPSRHYRNRRSTRTSDRTRSAPR